MRIGEVNENLEPIIELHIYDVLGVEYPLSAILDTGFTEQIALPAVHVAGLKLPRTTSKKLKMANEEEIEVDIREAAILWNGNRVVVEVCSIGDDVLAGMSLLFLSRIDIHVVPRGQIFLV